MFVIFRKTHSWPWLLRGWNEGWFLDKAAPSAAQPRAQIFALLNVGYVL